MGFESGLWVSWPLVLLHGPVCSTVAALLLRWRWLRSMVPVVPCVTIVGVAGLAVPQSTGVSVVLCVMGEPAFDQPSLGADAAVAFRFLGRTAVP